MPGCFEEGKVRQGADCDDGRAGLDAPGDQVVCRTGRRRSGRQPARPMALVPDDGIDPPPGRQRNRGAGGEGDVVAADQAENVGDVGRPQPIHVQHRGDPDQLDPRPAEEHRQGAGVIGVAAEVGVEVELHNRTRLRSHCGWPKPWHPPSTEAAIGDRCLVAGRSCRKPVPSAPRRCRASVMPVAHRGGVGADVGNAPAPAVAGAGTARRGNADCAEFRLASEAGYAVLDSFQKS